MANLISAVKALQKERSYLTTQLESLNNAIAALNGVSNRIGRKISVAGRARAKAKGQKVVPINARRRRTMSPAARRKIAAAQRLRWKRFRKAQKKS